MKGPFRPNFLLVLITAASAACASSRAQTAPGDGARPDRDAKAAMKPYDEVITDEAVSDSGLLK